MKKKFLTAIMCMLFLAPIFAEHPSIRVDDDGNHIYESTISSLVANGFKDRIVIHNGSSYDIRNIQCTIEFNGKKHKLLAIDRISSGRSDNFDGLEDNDMDEEIPYYFGKEAKFRKDNRNTVKIILKFSDNNTKVVITDIQFRDHDMYFYIENDPDFKVTEQNVEESVRVIIIDGKKYMLIGEQVIEVK